MARVAREEVAAAPAARRHVALVLRDLDDVELEEKQSHAESVNKVLCNEDAKSTLVHLHFRLLAVIDIAAKTFEN